MLTSRPRRWRTVTLSPLEWPELRTPDHPLQGSGKMTARKPEKARGRESEVWTTWDSLTTHRLPHKQGERMSSSRTELVQGLPAPRTKLWKRERVRRKWPRRGHRGPRWPTFILPPGCSGRGQQAGAAPRRDPRAPSREGAFL